MPLRPPTPTNKVYTAERRHGRAVQVDGHQLDPGLKALGFQMLELFESKLLSKL